MEKKEYQKMEPPQLVTYFEECVEESAKNPEDMKAMIYKEEVKSHIVIQLAKLVLL